MSVVFRCLVIFSLLFRVLATDAMALSMAMNEATTYQETSLQVSSADKPCDHAPLHNESVPSGQPCCDHEQHAKCFDCCLGALMVSSPGVLPSLLRPPFLPAANVAYVGIDLTQLTKPPIF